MPRDLGTTEASSATSNKETDQTLDQSSSTSRHKDASRDFDGFERVDHDDIAADTADDTGRPGAADHELSLQRFGNNLEEPESILQDDDSEDDERGMASHPLFGMLAGRLGQRRRGSMHRYDQLHPENQILSVSNVDDCVEVEEAFPEHERCSREKFEYRLTKCPELSLGLFTQPTREEVENGATQKRTLMAHIVATRTAAPCVTDASMEFPQGWKTAKRSKAATGEPVGNEDIGGTICIHSLAVRPEYQNTGLGTVLLKAYIQRIKDSRSAERLALLAHDDMKKFYKRFGFDDVGPSVCKFGGGGWNNMILEFDDLQDD